jgi:DNA-binding transcriptional regulator PaaX
MDYNQLKRALLRCLADRGPANSNAIFDTLLSKRGDAFEIHAIRMALMRYYRQGLLTRVRSQGEFEYSLSTRGIARLAPVALSGASRR